MDLIPIHCETAARGRPTILRFAGPTRFRFSKRAVYGRAAAFQQNQLWGFVSFPRRERFLSRQLFERLQPINSGAVALATMRRCEH